MKQLTATGQTVDDAVKSALEQLQTSRDQVEVDVIDEGKKGFLGFGNKPAIVKVKIMEASKPEPEVEVEETAPQEETSRNEQVSESIPEETAYVEEDPIEEAGAYIKSIADQMGAPVDVEVKVNNRDVHMELVGDKIAKLIGKRGQTLNALQYLLHLSVNRQTDQFYTVVLDAEGYRNRRKETLETLAGRLADKALRTNQAVKLEPMPSYERKIIHTALQNNRDVETYSDGNDPKRHVVIKPSK
ncbi:RNA-binding cell elongation regulator Jag/EloR [Thalassobacillus hwangdonensis]|uniref:RNA-binding protein KhpB n=1 Tax=Thalassobacillus hwangdonensis TaxID=546108 RepID=A0ABW3L0D9_9BACI